MILVTGDTHGDFERLIFDRDLGISSDDYLIVCGDFGGTWSDSDRERQRNALLSRRLPCPLLWVDGNHENYDALSEYSVTEWCGGKVQIIEKNIIHLMRGQVYTIEGQKIFTFGGAASHDIDSGILEPDDPNFYQKRRMLDRSYAMYRINQFSWWKEEMPSDEEMAEGLRNLEAHDWQVDYILSHCAPTSLLGILGNGLFKPDRLTDYLETIRQQCSFKHWYFGHYHEDRNLLPKFTVLYEGIKEVVRYQNDT